MKRLFAIFLLCLCASGVFAGDFNLGTGVSTTVPAGIISMYGGSSAPTGWLACDGSAVSRTTYARLYAAVGLTYGSGDGTTTFNVPDMRGVFPKGMGQNGKLGANYANASGTPAADKFQGHWHQGWVSASDQAYTGGGHYGLWDTTAGTGNQTFSATANAIRAAVTDGSTTPRTGAITEPANVGVYYIIKY